MNDTLFNFLGVAVGTFGGIVASSKLVNYRLQELEKKVDKHNSVIQKEPYKPGAGLLLNR